MKKFLKKPRYSILVTQLAAYLLIILVITVVFSVFFFSTARRHLEQEVGRKLQDIAAIAARNTPSERLELIEPGGEKTRMVLRLKEKLSEIKAATGVDNIAVFLPNRRVLLDLRPGYRIGAAFNGGRFSNRYLERLRKGVAVHTGSYRRNEERFFISAYAPVSDNKGRLFAVVAVDAGTREVAVIERLRSRLYWVAFAGVLLAVILATVLASRLTRPIRGMAQAAERIGSGDYEVRVPLSSISEIGVLGRSLNEMVHQVERRDANLKEMSAGVAHEIRNPLNSIKLLITLLGEELSDGSGDNHSGTIQTLHYEIGKLDRFLTEFLTYSRPLTLARDTVDAATLAQKTVQMAAAEAGTKGIEIVIERCSEPQLIHVDQNRLEQSLLNILLNAIHASVAGSSVVLELNPSEDGKWVEISVSDRGPGIDASTEERLFEPFFTTKTTGTGLGLSNARNIVESHGGNILFQNIASGGARFTIRLPRGDKNAKEL